MASSDISSIRLKYKDRGEEFREENIGVMEPIHLFRKWLDEAIDNTDIVDPQIMCLSTVSKAGIPSSRMLVLGGITDQGFKFFTSYDSPKAKDMEENPNVALNFFWSPKNRQIRVEGRAEKLSKTESEINFHERPRSWQSFLVSTPQSERIPSREYADAKAHDVKELYAPDKDIPIPNWGGYLVVPNSIEFGQGGSDRLHDRIKFRKSSNPEAETDGKLVHIGTNGWVYERLSC